jgi:phosphoribosyl 1,2-cyclic phosphodiesterase
MILISVQSGSNGNCVYVEAAGVRLLLDAGISGRTAERRLEEHGRDIRRVDGLIISHDHSDHVRCAGIYSRKFGLPVWISPRTMKAAARSHPLGRIDCVHSFRPGDVLDFGGVSVETVATQHDGVDGAAFVVCSEGKRLGVLTDLGHVFGGLEEIVESLDAVFVESNYDPQMLEEGPYPPSLKRRIKGPHGHLSNVEAAQLLRSRGGGLAWACLAHLSENNNRPELALGTHREIVGRGLALHVAGRYRASGAMRL